MKFQQIILRSSILVLALLSLVACDIQPVSVGEWDVDIAELNDSQSSTWAIASDGTINVTGNNPMTFKDALLDGSRVSWSGQYVHSSGQPLDANFIGTVSGNSFQGTIFTQLGNFILSGTRL